LQRLARPVADAALPEALSDDSPLSRLHRLRFDPTADPQDRERAAREVMEVYGSAMRASYARRWRCSLEDVEDCVQSTLLIFLTRTPRDCRVPEAWFHRIFIHLLINEHRRRSRSAVRSLDAMLEDPSTTGPVSLDGLSDPYQALLLKQVQGYLLRALGASSPGRAQVLALLCSGADNEDVARTLRLSSGAARDRIFRVRNTVRGIFADEL
jgi:DNA-directed RNA polymerase specialized sigma24 family protein